jgi:hypothetical protein
MPLFKEREREKKCSLQLRQQQRHHSTVAEILIAPERECKLSVLLPEQNLLANEYFQIFTSQT